MVCKRTFALAVLFASVTTAGFTQTPAPVFNPFQMRGSPQEEAACNPDARRHCKTAGDDELTVLRCLQANRTKISKACVKVLESHGQ